MNPLAVEDLLDKEQIREVIGPRYAWAMDWYDLELLKSCFHPDATLDYGYFNGDAHTWCKRRVCSEGQDVINRFHYVFPPKITLLGDVAETECSGIAGERIKKRQRERYHIFGTRYLDRLERRLGVWKIANRVVKIDFAQDLPGDLGPIGRFASPPFMAAPIPGRRHLDEVRAKKR